MKRKAENFAVPAGHPPAGKAGQAGLCELQAKTKVKQYLKIQATLFRHAQPEKPNRGLSIKFPKILFTFRSMKTSLIHCFLIFLLCQTVLKAQPQIDSITFFANKVLKPTHSDDLLQSYGFFERQNNRAEQAADTLTQIYSQYMLSLITTDMGLVFESEQYLVQNLVLIDAFSAHHSREEDYLRIYNQLGRLYRQLQNPAQSISYYSKGLKYAPKDSDSIVLLNNIGILYNDLHRRDSAKAYYQKAYQLSLNTTDTLQYARVLTNWFMLEAFDGNEYAVDSLLKAARLRQQLGDTKGLYSSYRNLTEVFLNGKQPMTAQRYADSALRLARQINSLSFLKDAYSLQIQLREDPLLNDYFKVVDSIERLELQQQNTYASLKYNVTKERERTLESQLRQEKERAEKQRYQAVAVIVFIIGVFVVYISRQRYKKAKEQEVYNTETRISKKVHDEVANDVYKVMSRLQTSTPTTPEILDELEGIYNKTRDISKENSLIALNGNFTETLEDLLLSYSDEQCSVITKNSSGIRWEGVDENKKRVIYRVLQELMTNMRKHSRATLAVVSFSQNRKKITINYQDNGLGTRLQKQTGLQNAENRIFAMNGSITFDTEPQKGFKVRFTL